jgi:hypothetical protein
MRKSAENIAFEKSIKKLLSPKFVGFKRFGLGGGALVGGGIGGTKGLIDAVNADRSGEMEEMEGKEKALEYLKKILAPGMVGLGTGAAVGLAGGEALKRTRIGQTVKGLKADIAKSVDGMPDLEAHKNSILRDAAAGYPEQNIFEQIKERILPKRPNKQQSV